MSELRARLIVLGMAILLIPLPVVTAQDQGENSVTVGDGPSDVELVIAGKVGGPRRNASETGSQFDHLDILKLVIGEETDASFKIGLYMKTLAPPSGQFPTRIITFAYGKIDWQLRVGGCGGGGRGGVGQSNPGAGCLQWRDASSRGYRGVKTINAETRDGGYVWTIEKSLLFNEQRAPARFGAQLTNISAYTTQTYATVGFPGQGSGMDPTGGVYATDRAPKDGYSEKLFEFVKGSGGRGHVGLNSAEPIRVSNGEATTIVYKAEIVNSDNATHTFELSTKNVADDWTVRVPALLSVEAGAALSFPVILALPFTHVHGKTALFQVRAQDVADPSSFADLDLGVFWTDVPQPSAHHECDNDATCGTWFHSAPRNDDFPPDAAYPAFPLRDYWINGVATDPDPDADDANAPAFFNDGLCAFQQFNGCQPAVPPKHQATWTFPLSPGLLLGLDFDVSRQGNARIVILPKVPASTATVVVELLYCDPSQQQRFTGGGGGQNQTCYDYRTLLAKGTGGGSLSQNAEATFEIPLAVEPVADLIPYRRGANIQLRVRLQTDTPQNLLGTEPRPEFVIKKSHLHLPLIEYHDPIDQAFEDVGTLSLTPLDPFEKPVNPGKTVVFRFDVASTAPAAQQIKVEVQGVHHEWVSLVGASEFELQPQENRNFSIVVAVPDDAPDEERAELFVVVQNVNDAAVAAVTRLRARVDTDLDYPDEAGMVQQVVEKKGIPGFEAILLLAGLVAAVAAARRRRI